jgi:hypothetical protein
MQHLVGNLLKPVEPFGTRRLWHPHFYLQLATADRSLTPSVPSRNSRLRNGSVELSYGFSGKADALLP